MIRRLTLPKEIETGVFAADLGAAADVDRDWAVLSLCRVSSCFSDHPVRREVYLIDKDDDHNPALASVVATKNDLIDPVERDAKPSSGLHLFQAERLRNVRPQGRHRR